eukprot:15471486-Alexandrium_andersonii.AAC.1
MPYQAHEARCGPGFGGMQMSAPSPSSIAHQATSPPGHPAIAYKRSTVAYPAQLCQRATKCASHVPRRGNMEPRGA